MQFSEQDRQRYTRLAGEANETGRRSLADLSRYVKDELVLHCPGSGYRLERKTTGRVVSMAGACRTLAACVWSDKPMASASARRVGKTARRQRKRRRGASQSLALDNGRTYFGAARGLARGKDVHEEFARLVMWDSARFCAMYDKVDPMTKAAHLHLKKQLRYTCVHAEFLVYDKRLGSGHATAVDLVCLDPDGHIVFVELKTGYQGTFNKHRAMMRAPLAHLPDSPLNRARTQLLYAMVLYASNHQRRPLGRVVHVDRDARANSYPMGDALLDPRLHQALREAIVAADLQSDRRTPARKRARKK